MLNAEQVRKIKELRKQFPQLGLESARAAIEEETFLLYQHPLSDNRYWDSRKAYEGNPPLFEGGLIRHEIPFEQGIKMLEKEELEELFS